VCSNKQCSYSSKSSKWHTTKSRTSTSQALYRLSKTEKESQELSTNELANREIRPFFPHRWWPSSQKLKNLGIDWLIAKRESSGYLPCSSCHLDLSERSWKTSQQQFKDMGNLEATKDQRDSSHLSCSSSHLDLSERSLENLATTNKRRDESWSGDDKQTKHT
jgi:hypothetical protein